MRNLLLRTIDLAGFGAAVCVLAICVLMIVQALGRPLGWPVGGLTEAVAWLCAAAAFLAMAQAFKHGDFVRVTLLRERLPPRAQHLLEVVALAIAAISTAYLAGWAAHFVYEGFVIREMAQGLIVIPIWIPQATLVVGAVLLMLAVLDELVLVLRGAKPTYVRLVEERHARGDFSEDL